MRLALFSCIFIAKEERVKRVATGSVANHSCIINTPKLLLGYSCAVSSELDRMIYYWLAGPWHAPGCRPADKADKMTKFETTVNPFNLYELLSYYLLRIT